MVAKSFECDELIMAVAIEWYLKEARRVLITIGNPYLKFKGADDFICFERCTQKSSV
jgi:hypothetical protein